MNRILAIVTLALLIPLALAPPAKAADPGAAFTAANASYEASDFEDSYTAYLEIVENEGISPNLFYNLGNSAYRLERPGEAALWYRRALALDPRHAESRQNLAVIEKQEGFLEIEWSFLQSFADMLPRRELRLIATAGAWAVALCLAIPFAAPRLRKRPAIAAVRAAGAISLAFAL
ncbi:MAG: tetratricopeptide repeat protein, partial [Verrucomicrobiales bacterium]